MEHRLAFRADDRVFAQIVEFRAATGAKAFGAKLGFSHRRDSCMFENGA
jgi:hypothetical protein